MICIILTPYSGSQYTAYYFQRNGLKLGHEKIMEDGIVDWRHTFKDLSQFDEIWHSVRHPLHCISSLFDLTEPGMSEIKTVLNIPVLSKLITAMRIWLEMNQFAEKKASKQIRVENLSHPGLPTTIHSKTHKEFSWQDLRRQDSALTDKIISKGIEYGYDLSLQI